MSEGNGQFRNHQTMAVLSVPNIGVLKPVHIHVELAVRVDIHVGNEEMCNRPSIPPSLDSPTGELLGLNLIWNLEVLQPIAPTGCFFILKKRIHTFARHIRRNSRMRFSATLTRSHSREFFQDCSIII
jgi:hypothetical protein